MAAVGPARARGGVGRIDVDARLGCCAASSNRSMPRSVPATLNRPARYSTSAAGASNAFAASCLPSSIVCAEQYAEPGTTRNRADRSALAARFFHRELAKRGARAPGSPAPPSRPWSATPGRATSASCRTRSPRRPCSSNRASPSISLTSRRGSCGSEAQTASLTLDETVRRAEREAFAVALAAAEGDAARAMEILGVSRTTYYRKLKELELG